MATGLQHSSDAANDMPTPTSLSVGAESLLLVTVDPRVLRGPN